MFRVGDKVLLTMKFVEATVTKVARLSDYSDFDSSLDVIELNIAYEDGVLKGQPMCVRAYELYLIESVD